MSNNNAKTFDAPRLLSPLAFTISSFEHDLFTDKNLSATLYNNRNSTDNFTAFHLQILKLLASQSYLLLINIEKNVNYEQDIYSNVNRKDNSELNFFYELYQIMIHDLIKMLNINQICDKNEPFYTNVNFKKKDIFRFYQYVIQYIINYKKYYNMLKYKN